MSAGSAKRRAAERAVELVEDGMTLGLGTGSTARYVLEVLAERQARGELTRVVGVPTSRATAELAVGLGLTLRALAEHGRLDLAIDGADEIDPRLDLIKGLGGALLWEKIVAAAADRVVIVADGSKLVDRLGQRAPLPVEVVTFGWTTHLDAIRRLGGDPELRRHPDGEAFVTDSGNHIIDCRFEGGIPDPVAVHAALKARPGVVETGLFAGMTDAVVVGTDDGVQVLRTGARTTSESG
ncbi:MAG: ribose-5-phosphate isomerase RpiA [Longimicrobiales bacterium]